MPPPTTTTRGGDVCPVRAEVTPPDSQGPGHRGQPEGTGSRCAASQSRQPGAAAPRTIGATMKSTQHRAALAVAASVALVALTGCSGGGSSGSGTSDAVGSAADVPAPATAEKSVRAGHLGHLRCEPDRGRDPRGDPDRADLPDQQGRRPGPSRDRRPAPRRRRHGGRRGQHQRPGRQPGAHPADAAGAGRPVRHGPERAGAARHPEDVDAVAGRTSPPRSSTPPSACRPCRTAWTGCSGSSAGPPTSAT